VTNAKTHNAYAMNLDQNAANFVPLTPLTFIERAASVYPHHTAVVHGPVRRNWSGSAQLGGDLRPMSAISLGAPAARHRSG